MLRTSVVAASVGAVIVIGVKLAFPLIQLPPIWQMLLGIPAIYAYLLIPMGITMMFPSVVEIRKDRIFVYQGQSRWLVQGEEVTKARIVIFANNRIRLRVFYMRNNKMRSGTLGVRRKVKLDDLATALPINPQVWDARSRYDKYRARKLVK